MAKKNSPATAQSATAAAADWSTVTWPQLVDQFGERTVSRGERYQRSGQVRDLGVLPTGELIAFVDGSETYATRVTLFTHRKKSPDIVGECSCPVGSQCKHAVAVVLQALAELQAGRELTAVEDEESDERLLMLSEDTSGEDGDDNGFSDEFDDSEDDYVERPSRRRPKKVARKSTAEVLKFVEGLPIEEARKLLKEVIEQQPAVREELERRLLLSSPETDKLVQRTLKEVRRVTAEPAWHDHWRGVGSNPDFTLLRQLLERLSELGAYDELLEIGRELRQRGLEQVGQSDDDGMLGSSLSNCLEVVFAAIPKSSLPVPEQLLYAIDAIMDDDYSICDAAAEILDEPHAAADWSVVADQLASRVDRKASKDRTSSAGWSGGYRRGVVARFLISALDEAGRSDEALRWCEIEAVENGEYVQLCKRLQELGHFQEMRSWIQRGISATQKTSPGWATELRTMLVEDWKRTKDWALVAACAAAEFCRRPDLSTWKDLLKAAKRAKCESQVSEALLWHLERGRIPDLVAGRSTSPKPPAKSSRSRGALQSASSTEQPAQAWPLPPLPKEFDGASEQPRRPETLAGFLVDLAIDERRIDDVIRLYEPLRQSDRKQTIWGWNPYGGDRMVRVADAVAAERPEYALSLRQNLLERALQPTGNGAYDAVIQQLLALRPLLQQLHREDEYVALIERIRTEHRRRRNLIEKLDRLERPRVIDSVRTRS